MKNKIMVISSMIFVIEVLITTLVINSYQDYEIIESAHIIKDKSNMVGVVLLQESEGSSTYIEQTGENADAFPTTGYHINLEKSRCENGGSVSYDSINKKVLIDTNITDRCYIYFDIGEESSDSNGNNGIALTTKNVIINGNIYDYYENDKIGIVLNGLFYHDEKLINGAGDNSYRYSGDNPNNWVCFGYENISDCADGIFSAESEYAYRIIGILPVEAAIDENAENLSYSTQYLIKLIKNFKIYNYKTYGTNYTKDYVAFDGKYQYYNNTWETSTLKNILNSTNVTYDAPTYGQYSYYQTYYGNLDSSWQNMIATPTWNLDGLASTKDLTPLAIYNIEKNSTSVVSHSKIGLMYISDYLFAANPIFWNLSAHTSNSSGKLPQDYRLSIGNNWLWNKHESLDEWTISKYSSNSNCMFFISNFGYVDYSSESSNNSINTVTSYGMARPTFYLKSNVEIVSGNGSISSPYILSMNYE